MNLTKDQAWELGKLLQDQIWKHESNLRLLTLPDEEYNKLPSRYGLKSEREKATKYHERKLAFAKRIMKKLEALAQ